MPNRGPRKRHDPKLHRKPSGHYYAVFYDPDRAHRKRLWYSSGITDAQAAQEWFTDICRDWRRGMLDPWSQKQQRERGLGEAINCYFKAHPNLKPTTVVTRVSLLSSFTRHLPAGVTLSLVNEEHITSFLGRPDLVLETRHGYLSILRYFFSWCIKEQLLEADPTSSVKLPKLGRRIPEFLTPMEFRRLLAAVDAIYEEKLNRKPRSYIQEGDIIWVKAPIELAVATGLRISDVVRLRWAQVRRDAGIILVDDRTKTGNEYTVPILELAEEVLSRQAEERDEDGLVFHSPSGGPLSKGNLQNRIRQARTYARLPKNISFHSLRHTFAMWRLMQTGNIRLVSVLLGHTTLDQTQNYAHVALLAMRSMNPAEFEALGVSWHRYVTPHQAPGDGAAHDQSGLMMSPSLMPGTLPSYESEVQPGNPVL